ncbi:hypothetical protein FRC09_015248 [Ceratobasidium sp. 395]|nr:hypothetical protein FRC09_015248 [Ceratobasidium sp. 395]
MSEQGFVGQRHDFYFDDKAGFEPTPNKPPHPSHQDIEYTTSFTNPWTTISPLPNYDAPAYESHYSPSDVLPAHQPVDSSDPSSYILPRNALDLNANAEFGQDAARPTLFLEGGCARQMEVPGVGLDESKPGAGLHQGYHIHPQSNPELQKHKNSTGVASWLMRTLSIENYLGSSKGDSPREKESGTLRSTNKLVKRRAEARTREGRATSTVSLPPGIGAGCSPVKSSPLLGPGASDNAKRKSSLGHDSQSGHESVVYWGTTSPASDQLSRSTTQSAPARLDAGRKLVKKWKMSAERAETTTKSARQEVVSTYDGFTHEPFLPNNGRLEADVDRTQPEDRARGKGPRLATLQRRWTLADVDDVEFLRQLEANLTQDGSRLGKSRMLEEFIMGTDHDYQNTETEVDLGYETDESAAERDCARARRAILCVREIVRTEGNYMRAMSGLLETNQPALSPILFEHLPHLIKISAELTARLEDDPSVWGVSAAFLAIEEHLEKVLVSWSSVVGQVISSTRTWGNNLAISEDGHAYGSSSGNSASLWTRRRSATTGALPAQQLRLTLAMTPLNDNKTTRAANRRKMAEQNVAIMPTQRALRYVLMYRELLLNTPPSSLSYPLVELALQGATRIARLCDEAQTLETMHSPK